MNSNSAPAQIARAPNEEKIRKFPRVENLTDASFSGFLCVVCLPLWIINLSIPPLLSSSSYPIFRGAPSDDCPDGDPIASPKLWPPLLELTGVAFSRLLCSTLPFDATLTQLNCSSPRATGLSKKWWRVALKLVCTQSLFSRRIDRTAYQFEKLCAAPSGFWFGQVLFILDSISPLWENVT